MEVIVASSDMAYPEDESAQEMDGKCQLVEREVTLEGEEKKLDVDDNALAVEAATLGESKRKPDGAKDKKQYPQRYRPSWEELDFCTGWLQPHPTDRVLALCKVCDKTLHSRKNDLRKHALCERHKQNMTCFENGTPTKSTRGSKYRVRFHPGLLIHPELSEWLRPMPGNQYRAWCRWCACKLTPQLKPLKVHGQSRKHTSNRTQPPQSPPPAQSPLAVLAGATSSTTLLQSDAPLDVGCSTPCRSGGSLCDRAPSPLLESDFLGRVTYSIGLGNRKVGFLGAGQISQAIAQGMLEQGLLLPTDIMVSAPSMRNMGQWKRWKCRTTRANDMLLQEADIIFLAVKASVLVQLVENLASVSDSNTRLFISVIPGVSRARITELLQSRISPAENVSPDDAESGSLYVVRCSPNKMVSISAGFCAYCMGDNVPHALYLVLETMFSALGTCVQVEEALMDVYSTMVSSGAAFTCAFIEALVQGGVNLGIAWDDALRAAATVVSGTSKLLMRTGADPSTLRKAVATPGGSTIAGLNALQRGGLDEAVVTAMDISCAKTSEAGKKV